ncbi:DUF1398 family protein [Escherichia coli]|uniref:DUF1398 family protein n=1 Tax=Escherichia coli TaxID=562 RepID=UPI000BE16FF7|nr:DUF1398 family protein [Escherichia coli]
MDQIAILHRIFEQVRKEQNYSLFHSELKEHNVIYYIYYLATDNIRVVTENNEILLIRGARSLLKVNKTQAPERIKEAVLNHVSGNSTFQEYTASLAHAGVFRWVVDVNDNKRRYFSINNTLLYIEDIEHNKALI